MNTHYLSPKIESGALRMPDPFDRNAAANHLDIAAATMLQSARSRLAAAARWSAQQKGLAGENPVYYGVPSQEPRAEETIGDMTHANLGGIVTRNHYGSLVLNAFRTLFMDVDFTPQDSAPGEVDGHNLPSWQTMLNDLCLVLKSEGDLGFRVYRTKAGFRMLATNREFEPGEPRVKELMNAVSADSDFVQLCRIQNNFRARLTPKPWRCGVKRPPSSFPRTSTAAERSFGQWLGRYERACRDRATCQFLGHVGPHEMHLRIAPIIELHDRETKALQSLPLA